MAELKEGDVLGCIKQITGKCADRVGCAFYVPCKRDHFPKWAVPTVPHWYSLHHLTCSHRGVIVKRVSKTDTAVVWKDYRGTLYTEEIKK